MMLNDITDGGGTPSQWKESRVALVYKGWGVSELKIII